MDEMPMPRHKCTCGLYVAHGVIRCGCGETTPSYETWRRREPVEQRMERRSLVGAVSDKHHITEFWGGKPDRRGRRR